MKRGLDVQYLILLTEDTWLTVLPMPMKSLALSVLVHLFLFSLLFMANRTFIDLPLGVHRKADPAAIEIDFVKSTASASSRSELQNFSKREVPIQKAEIGEKEEGELGHPEGIEASQKERYLFELRMLIEGRKIFPAVSRRLGESGRVMVEFEVLRDGRIESVRVQAPSHFQRLNKAAVELIKGIEKFKPLPEEIGSEKITIQIPIEYVLS